MSREQRMYTVVGLLVAMLACTAAWLAVPQVQALFRSLPLPPSQSGMTNPQTAPHQGEFTSVHLEDADWQGGNHNFRISDSPTSTNTYGGRTAICIYGIGSEYSTMIATLTVPSKPFGQVQLTIVGMDDEKDPKTPISIQINGRDVFNDLDPLSNDDYPFETGQWSSYTWTFDAGYLQIGPNTITISNLKEGSFGLPPWFMLDYADIIYTT